MNKYGWLWIMVFGLFAVAFPQRLEADMIEAQEALTDLGLYGGPVNGVATDETVKAIRRFQIRNGLPVTGALDSETSETLIGDPINQPNQQVFEEDEQFLIQEPANETDTTPGDFSDLRIIDFDEQEQQVQPTPAPASGSNRPTRTSSNKPSLFNELFQGGPYANVETKLQRQIIRDAQSVLKQEGYYRGAIDGIPGSGTRSALVNWQRNTGMQPTGRLDYPTLARMGLAGNDPGSIPQSGKSVAGPPATAGPPTSGQVIYEGRPVQGGYFPPPVRVYGGVGVVYGRRPVYRPRVGIRFRGPRGRVVVRF